MIDRALFLSRLEFSVLLMAGGVEQIPCFPLPERDEVKEREMIEAVYDLVQKKLLETREEKICLVPEIAELVRQMKDSRDYVQVEPGEEGEPQRMIYLESQAVVLENTTDTCPQFRLFVNERSRLWNWMEEALDLPAPGSQSKEEATEQVRLSELASGEQERLTECVYPGVKLGIRSWMRKLGDRFGETPRAGIRLVCGGAKQAIQDLVVLPGAMNLWFLWCVPEIESLSGGEKAVWVVPDSSETRKKIETWFQLQ